MRIDYVSQMNQYHAASNKGIKKDSNNKADEKSGSMDTVEISNEAISNYREASKVQSKSNTWEETYSNRGNCNNEYDLSKVMAIHEKGFHEIPTREESEYYWTARRNDPELDAQLYAQDKAAALKEVGQVQNILMKALSGQQLTPEEQEMVDNDPALKQEVEMRKSQRKMWE